MAISKGTLSWETTRYKNLIPILICLSLAILTVIAFSPVMDCGFINLDDNIFVYENIYVQSGFNWNSIRQAFSIELLEKAGWVPLTWLSLMLDSSIFGINPFGYHLTNLLLHVMNTILLFLILCRMTKAHWPSAFVAALFAIHPLHVESVVWIAERRDVLSTFFMMLTLGAYGYYVEHRNLKRYAFVLLFFILGLISKPMLVTLPFVLLLLDYWPLGHLSEVKATFPIPVVEMKSEISGKKKKSRKKDVEKAVSTVKSAEIIKPSIPAFKWSLISPLLLEKIPLFFLAIVSSIATYIAAQSVGFIHSELIPLDVRIENAIFSYIAYIGQMIWPSKLAVFYPHPESLSLWQVSGAALFLVAITLTVFWMAKKFPYLATGWLWYVITLVPVIGIIQLGSQARADRYTYIPLIGLFIMVAWGVKELLKKWKLHKEILFSASVLILIVLSILTYKQVGYWQNSITLYDHTLKVTENNWFLHVNRGLALNDLGDANQALADCSRAIEIKPGFPTAHNCRGIAYKVLGNYNEAIKDYNRAIEMKPDFADAYNNRGNVYNSLGNYTLAIENYNKAIEMKSGFAQAYINRGAAYIRLGNYMQAIENFNKAIAISPGYSMAYNSRGNAYFDLGNHKEAIADYNRVIEIKPYYPDAYLNRRNAFVHLGNYHEAIADYSRAIELKPDYTGAYKNRGIAYMKSGNNNLAVDDLKTAAKSGDEQASNFLRSKGINW
ncbi:MAG: hypothetical protein CVU43_19890 [Chloroflexi bacterium HGW-Chloroflexi-5]|jgi:tetratricopeptide (TPR) repeat protein|nr:MAG: hypothetical protein CVU43_19890 [Chloroflexi bacterium HGW-Chloroflexi-5]